MYYPSVSIFVRSRRSRKEGSLGTRGICAGDAAPSARRTAFSRRSRCQGDAADLVPDDLRVDDADAVPRSDERPARATRIHGGVGLDATPSKIRGSRGASRLD